MHKSKHRQQEIAGQHFLETWKMQMKFRKLLEGIQKEEDLKIRKQYAWWKVAIRWMFRLCSGGGTV
jgi:hypothetical protein